MAAAGEHRGAKPVDLVVAAAAEAEGLTVLHYDADYERIAEVTGQPTEWVAPRGQPRPLTPDEPLFLTFSERRYRRPRQLGDSGIVQTGRRHRCRTLGLVTVKELLDEGHRPSCLERAPSLGGVFRFAEQDGELGLLPTHLLGAAHRVLGLPRGETRRPHDRGASTSTTSRVLRRFGCHATSSLRRSVGSVRPAPRRLDGGASARSARRALDEHFDAVAVCSGLDQLAAPSAVPGPERSPGTCSTAPVPAPRAGRRQAGARGRRRRVGRRHRGRGRRARRGDGALASARGGRAAAHDARAPQDYRTSRLINSPADWIAQTRIPRRPQAADLPDALLPLLVVDEALQVTSRHLGVSAALLRRRPTGRRDQARDPRPDRSGCWRNPAARSTSSSAPRPTTSCGRSRWSLPPRARDRAFEGATRGLRGRQPFEPDLVIFCTGFEAQVAVSRSADRRDAALPAHVQPRGRPSLAFIGFVRPAFGAIPPLAELQARWFAQLLSGQRRAAGRRRMRASIARLAALRGGFFRALSRTPRRSSSTSLPFCDALAAEIGCKPTAPRSSARAGASACASSPGRSSPRSTAWSGRTRSPRSRGM